MTQSSEFDLEAALRTPKPFSPNRRISLRILNSRGSQSSRC